MGTLSSTSQITHKGKGNNPWPGEIDPSVDLEENITMDRVPLITCGAMGVERLATG